MPSPSVAPGGTLGLTLFSNGANVISFAFESRRIYSPTNVLLYSDDSRHPVNTPGYALGLGTLVSDPPAPAGFHILSNVTVPADASTNSAVPYQAWIAGPAATPSGEAWYTANFYVIAPPSVPGCMDPTALNYNASATYDPLGANNSCRYAGVLYPVDVAEASFTEACPTPATFTETCPSPASFTENCL